jgi:hypothetical protein
MASKDLKNRMWSYELSAIEQDLLFRRKDAGFVRFVGRDKRLFFLDPSPFLKGDENQIYFCETPPSKGSLIQAEVEETRKEIVGNTGQEHWLYIHIIHGWKSLDISEVGNQRSSLSQDDLLHYFTLPFTGEIDDVEAIGRASILFSVSSPACGLSSGGIHAAILGEKRAFSGINRLMTAIPSEFSKPSSEYFYKTAVKESPIIWENREVNVAYLNPKVTAMHVPLTAEGIKIRSQDRYRDDFDLLRPMVSANILTAILRTPLIPESIDSHLLDVSYLILEECMSAALPYQQDKAELVPKLTRSAARFFGKSIATNEIVDYAANLWIDLVTKASKVMNTAHPIAQLYGRLNDDSRRLYFELKNRFGYDVPIPRVDVEELRSIFKHEDQFDEALARLNNNGLLIFPRPDTVRLLDKS